MGKIDPKKKAELGRKLKAAREREGYNQTQIAGLFGFSTPTVSRMEKGVMPNVLAIFLIVLFALILQKGGLIPATEKVKRLKRYRLCGAKILEKREEMGITQRELAEELKVSRTTVNRWERGYFDDQIGSYRWLIIVLDWLKEELANRKKEAKAA